MQPLLMPGNGTAPPRFRIGDLEVDIGKAEVTRGGEKIALPKLSFDLLCALINAAPAIATNEDLLQQVWPGLVVSPESVAQRVKLLRSAIGDDSQQPRYILGVRGRGYRLISVPERLAESRLPTNNAISPPIDTPSAAEMVGHGSAASPQAMPSRRGVGKRVGIIAAVLGAVSIVLVSGLRYCSPSHHGAPPAAVAKVDKSIAVLPFVDMSEKKDQEYFADGMAEEIINLLAKIPGLKIIGRTSSFQFKGKAEDLKSIATQLKVAYLLQGSVRKSGDHLRVTAQLINAQDGTHLWSETYDRSLSDVLTMQDEIATKVAGGLETEVVMRDYLSRPALRSPEAYTLFLQGVHVGDGHDRQSFDEAVSDFKRALEIDPTFAEASGVLAGSIVYGVEVGYIPAGVGIEQARRAAEHSIELDPNGVVGYGILGDINTFFDWDWTAAERNLKHAVALTPNNPRALQGAAIYSLTMGHSDDALNLITAARELDPLDPGNYYWLGIVQLRRDRLPEAEAAIRRCLEIAPDYIFAPYALGVTLLARGQPQAALAAFLNEPSEAARIRGSAMAYFALGRKADSDAALAFRFKEYAIYPFVNAEVYAFRGESDEAFKWLERAFAQKDVYLYTVKFSQSLRSLEGDPRFKAFLKKMNLPE
jgi:TolB-like protein/DNA-binding winged helix-turn-helix (wHTH) protein